MTAPVDIDNGFLQARAADYLQQALEVACGPGGLFIAFPRFDTRRPFQEGEVYEGHWTDALDLCWGPYQPKPSFADWYYGENTLYVTGCLLWAQMVRYQVTRAPEALEVARKCFRDLNHVFDLCREIQPGLLGKPHGGRAGATTSFDQSGIPVVPYARFALELADEPEKQQARQNLADHGNWYLRNNWIVNHHGNLCRIIGPGHTSTMKYLACVYAAYEVTGITEFRDAAVTQVRQLIRENQLPWPSPTYELNHNLFYWAWLAEYWSKTELAKDAPWIDYIGEYWQAARRGLDGQGLLLAGEYDTNTRAFTPHADGWITAGGGGGKPRRQLWRSARCYAGRSMASGSIACTAILAYAHGHDPEAPRMALRTLVSLDPQRLRQWFDDGSLPQELKPMLNMFAPEVACIWQLAYWMGRLHGAWHACGILPGEAVPVNEATKA